jgi:hypothetical protein
MASKSAATEGSDMPPVHHVTTGPQPERLSSEVGDTFLCPQYARGRHLLSGYYAPTNILSVNITVTKNMPFFFKNKEGYFRSLNIHYIKFGNFIWSSVYNKNMSST